MSKHSKCRGPVVLDTSFLITLASKSRKHHVVAKRYFAFWIEARTPMILPSICAAEYLAIDNVIPPHILKHVVVKPFTYEDAICAAQILREGIVARVPGEDGKTPNRMVFKDDVKIIGSAVALQAAAIATEDERTMCRYIKAVSGGLSGANGLMALSITSGFNRGLAELSSPDLGIE